MTITLLCRCGRRFDADERTEAVICPACGESFRVRCHGGEFRLEPLHDARPRPASVEVDVPDELQLEELTGPLAPVEDAPRSPDDETTTVEFLPEEPEPPKTWLRHVREAWAYPLAGTAKWTLSFWLFCDLMFWLVFSHPLFTTPGPSLVLGFSGLIVRACLLATLAFYEFHLIHRSAWDPAETPTLPPFETAYESLLRPIVLVATAVAASALPYVVLNAGADAFGLSVGHAWSLLLTAARLLAAFLLPMNLLAVATADQARAVFPQYTLPAIARTAGPYVALCTFCALTLGLGHAFTAALVAWVDGALPARLLREVAMLYLLTVSARALGTFHAAYADRIGWLREPD